MLKPTSSGTHIGNMCNCTHVMFLTEAGWFTHPNLPIHCIISQFCQILFWLNVCRKHLFCPHGMLDSPHLMLKTLLRMPNHKCKQLLPTAPFPKRFCKRDLQSASWIGKLPGANARSWTEHRHCLLPTHAVHKSRARSTINEARTGNGTCICARTISLQLHSYLGCTSWCGCSNGSNTQCFRSCDCGQNVLSIFGQTRGLIQPAARVE